MSTRYPFPYATDPTPFQRADNYSFEPPDRLPKNMNLAVGLIVQARGPANQPFARERALYRDPDGILFTLTSVRRPQRGYEREDFLGTVSEADWARRRLA